MAPSPPTTLDEFLLRLNTLLNNLINARDLVDKIEQNPTWLTPTGKTALQAKFNTLVVNTKLELDELNLWVQGL